MGKCQSVIFPMKRLSMGALNAQDFYDERVYHLLHDMKKKPITEIASLGEEKHSEA